MTEKQLKNALRMESRQIKRPRRVAKKIRTSMKMARLFRQYHASFLATLNEACLGRRVGQDVSPDDVKRVISEWYARRFGGEVVSVTVSDSDPDTLDIVFQPPPVFSLVVELGP